MSKNESQEEKSPSRMIDERIRELGGWRGQMLSQLRALIKQADPAVIEEWKWRGVPVWSHDGIICTGETDKSVVKMTFAKGAAFDDRPAPRIYRVRTEAVENARWARRCGPVEAWPQEVAPNR